jgi:hypothetical protein
LFKKEAFRQLRTERPHLLEIGGIKELGRILIKTAQVTRNIRELIASVKLK